jgi:hypothetical protein
MNARLKIGCGLVTLAYALLLFNAISSTIFVRQSPEHAHEHMEYIASWPVSLTVAVVLLGIITSLIPLRKGELWAWMATGITWSVIAIPRLINDPRCLQLDLNRHGCHTFMITLVVAAVGFILARPRRQTLS